MSLLLSLLAMLVLLAAGIAARRIGILEPTRRERLNAFAYYVALPALILSSTYDQPLSEVLSAQLLVGVVGTLLAVAGIAALLHSREADPATRSVATVQSYHSNLGYLGVPVVATTFGSLATAKAALILGVAALVQIGLTVTILTTMNDADASLHSELGNVFANPAIVSVIVGLAASVVGVTIPGVADTGLDYLGQLALPIALLCVGAALTLEADAIPFGTVSAVVVLKLVAMPVIALGAFVLVGADASTVRAGVVMMAMPSAVSTYVFASELGGDRQLASINVFATTVCSVASLLLVVQVIRAVV
ncbi:AEC family transporter [Salinarchaeum chitinilyticum]